MLHLRKAIVNIGIFSVNRTIDKMDLSPVYDLLLSHGV